MRVRVLARVTATFGLIACSVIAMHPITSHSASATTVTFTPTGDAYVASNAPKKNFGNTSSLQVNASSNVLSYLQFTISGLTQAPRQASLRLYNLKSSTAGYTLKTVADTTWSARSIDYANAPTVGASVAASGATAAGSWTVFDVTALVHANGQYSFALVGTGATSAASVSSSEGANPPQLVLDLSTASTSSSVIPANFTDALGAYDPSGGLSGVTRISLDHYFVSWDVTTQWITGVNQHQALLSDIAASSTHNHQIMVTLEPWSVSGLDPSTLLTDIVSGKYDSNITWACTDFKNAGLPILVRWGHEMDNLQPARYPWSTSNTQQYVAAFQYFVTKCRSMAPNTQYVWSPAGNANLSGYYPGSSYVDEIGLSVYDYPAWEIGYFGYNRSFDQNFSERYGYVKAYEKPILIAEMGAIGTGSVQWLADAFADMTNFPLLHAVVLFNSVDPLGWGPGYPGPEDWRLSPVLLQ